MRCVCVSGFSHTSAQVRALSISLPNRLSNDFCVMSFFATTRNGNICDVHLCYLIEMADTRESLSEMKLGEW